MSNVLQRFSLRNQNLVHSSLAPHISGMKYKYSTMRERSTGEGCRVGVIEQLHFFHNIQHVTLALLYQLISLSLSISLSYTNTISYENISPSSNVKGLATLHSSAQCEADQRRSLHSTWQISPKSTGCLSPVKAATLHKYEPKTPEGEGQQNSKDFLPVQTEPPDSEYQPKT